MTKMKKQLEAAEQLINDLGSEKIGWGEEKDKLGKIFKNYIGDCLITAAFLNYSGGFTHDFRSKLTQFLCTDCCSRKIPTSV